MVKEHNLFMFQKTCSTFFLNLFSTVLGLRCCTRAFSSCSKQGLLPSCDTQASLLVASLAAEEGPRL